MSSTYEVSEARDNDLYQSDCEYSTTVLRDDERTRLKEKLMLEWRANRKDTFHALRVECFNTTNTSAVNIAVERRADVASERKSLSDRYLPNYFREKLHDRFCQRQRSDAYGGNRGVRSLFSNDAVNSHGNYPSRHLLNQIAEERRRQAVLYQRQRDSLVHFHSTQKDDNLTSIIEVPKSAEHVLALKSLFMSWAGDGNLLPINGDNAPDLPALIDRGIFVSNTHRHLNGASMLFTIPGSCSNDYWRSESGKWAELVFDWLDILGCLQDPIDAAITAAQDEEAFQKREADIRLKVGADVNYDTDKEEEQNHKDLKMPEKRKARKRRNNRPLFITMSDWIILTCCDLIKDWEMVATMRNYYDKYALNRRQMVADYNINYHVSVGGGEPVRPGEWTPHAMLEDMERARMYVQPKIMRQRQLESDRVARELIILERMSRHTRSVAVPPTSRLKLALYGHPLWGVQVPPVLGATSLHPPISPITSHHPQSATHSRPQSASLRRPQSASSRRPQSASSRRPHSAALRRAQEPTPTHQHEHSSLDYEEDENNKYISARKNRFNNISMSARDRELQPEDIFREASKLLSCGLCLVDLGKKEPDFTVRTKEYIVVKAENNTKEQKIDDNSVNLDSSFSATTSDTDADNSDNDKSEKISHQAKSSSKSGDKSNSINVSDSAVQEKGIQGPPHSGLLPFTASVPPLTFSVSLLLLIPHRFKMYLVKSNIRFYPTLAPDMETALSGTGNTSGRSTIGMYTYGRREAGRFYGAITPGGRAAIIQTRKWLQKINDPTFSERWKNKVVIMKKNRK